jgi:hypothetical protein
MSHRIALLIVAVPSFPYGSALLSSRFSLRSGSFDGGVVSLVGERGGSEAPKLLASSMA